MAVSRSTDHPNRSRKPWPISGLPLGNRLIGPCLILAAAALATAPEFLRGTSCGHDFDFHLVSWFDCLAAWKHGILYPPWAPSANYGAGEPRFVFYPPLTWMLGAFLGIFLPWQGVPAILTFVLLAATGLATRALARQFLSDRPATLAGCAALFSGYALFTAYERSAFGELAGGFWIPVLLLLILKTRSEPSGTQAASQASVTVSATDELDHREAAPSDNVGESASAKSVGFNPRKNQVKSTRALAPEVRFSAANSAASLALVLAGAWLSNAPVGVMASYLLAAVALVISVLDRSWVPILRASIGTALGIGLSAFYILPAAYEQRWVDIRQAIDDPGERIENSFLFGNNLSSVLAWHNLELHRVSVIAVSMTAVALVSIAIAWYRKALHGNMRRWLPLALIPVAVILLQLSPTLPLWNLLPKLRFLQFPWRWLVVLEAPMSLFFAGAVWPRASAKRWLRWAVPILCAATFLGATFISDRFFFQPCDDEDAVAPMLQVYRSGNGFQGTDEYEPPAADNTLVATGLPDACLVTNPDATLGIIDTKGANPDWWVEQHSCDATFSAAVQPSPDAPEHFHLHTTIAHDGYLILRLRTYPAWRVSLNGQPVGIGKATDQTNDRDDGLFEVPVQKGPVDLRVDWKTTTDVLVGRWLSVASLFALILLAARRRIWNRQTLAQVQAFLARVSAANRPAV